MESTLLGAFASTGQRCTATSRVIVEEKIADQFVAALVERAQELRVGDGLDAGVDMGPLVDEKQMKTVLRYIDIGKKEAQLLCGGERLSGPEYDKAGSLHPTIFDHVRPRQPASRRKRFSARCFRVIRVRNFDEALRGREFRALRPFELDLHQRLGENFRVHRPHRNGHDACQFPQRSAARRIFRSAE